MKRAILACAIYLAGAGALAAQEKLLPAQIIDPADPLGVSKFFQNRKNSSVMTPPQTITLTGVTPGQAGVCSVPLLTANADTNLKDRIAVKPSDGSARIGQAHVPAPSCDRK